MLFPGPSFNLLVLQYQRNVNDQPARVLGFNDYNHQLLGGRILWR